MSAGQGAAVSRMTTSLLNWPVSLKVAPDEMNVTVQSQEYGSLNLYAPRSRGHGKGLTVAAGKTVHFTQRKSVAEMDQYPTMS